MLDFIVENWEIGAYVLTGLVFGAIGALRYIAPLTETDKDDKVLSKLEVVGAWLGRRFKPRA